MAPPEHPTYDVYAAIDIALAEDAGDYGDVSTLSTCAAGASRTRTCCPEPWALWPVGSHAAHHLPSQCLARHMANAWNGTPTLLCPPAPCRRAEVTAPLPACRSVPEGTQARATFLAKAPGVLAGVWVAHAVFARVDPAVSLSWARSDGDRVQPGEILGEAQGSAR